MRSSQLTLVAFACALTAPAFGQDQMNITIARHVNANAANVPAMLATGSGYLQSANGGCGDVVSCLEVNQASLTTFGSAGDGLDVITTSSEENTVFNVGSQAKVVIALNSCGGSFNASIIGCATTPFNPPSFPGASRNMILEEDTNVSAFGAVWIHELGHTQSLNHDDSCGSLIMGSSINFSSPPRAVTAAQSVIWRTSPDVADPSGCGGGGGPMNDTCANADTISGTGTFPWSNINATTGGPSLAGQGCLEGEGTTGSQVNFDVWYEWTAPFSGSFDILTATGVDTRLAVFSSCGATIPIVCDDDTGGPTFNSLVNFSAVGGTSYWIEIGSWEDDPADTFSSTFAITGMSSGPANDECANADAIGGTGTFAWSNVGATTGGPSLAGQGCLVGEATTGSLVNSDVWFSWFATSSGVHEILTAPDVDTRLAVFSSCGATVPIACDDDSGGPTFNSLLSFTAVAGQTYWIEIGSWDDDPAVTFTSSFDISTVGRANDDCASATALSLGSTTMGSTVGAGSDTAPFCGTSDDSGGGVWYTVVGTGTTLRATTCGQASYDTKIRVYRGNCGALVCVDGIDDTPGCSNNTSEVTWCSVPGELYRILVHGFQANEGSFSLTVDEANASNCNPGISNYCQNGGNGAVMTSSGSLSISANNFALNCAGAPTTPGIFFFGLNEANLVFGEGFRCVGAPIFRLPPATVPTIPSLAVRPLNFFGSGNEMNITPGVEWHFQYWFRAPGGGGLFDLSDGLEVVFAP